MLVLNLAPVQFQDTEIRVGVIPYRANDTNQLQNLRAKYNLSHVFLRDRQEILCVPVVPRAEEVGDTFRTIRLTTHLRLCAALAQNALLTYVHQLGRAVYGYRPLRFAASGQKNNLLSVALPSQQRCPDWLLVHPLYEIEVRVFFFDKRPPFVGMTLNVRTTQRIGLPCNALLAQHIPLDGLYVCRTLPQSDVRLEPRLQLVGQVERTDGEVLTLSDALPGVTTVQAGDVVLDSNRKAFQVCLEHVFGKHVQEVQALLENERAKLHTGPTRLQKLREVVQHFAKTQLEMVPGVPITIHPFLSSTHHEFPPVQYAPKPVYVFDPTNVRIGTWHDGGLNTHGPYSATR